MAPIGGSSIASRRTWQAESMHGESPHLRVLVGSPAGGLLSSPHVPDGTLLLDLGPDHPTRAGLLELHLWLSADQSQIAAADVQVGALHRGVEKLFEVRDYRQVLMLANRHDWHAPFAGELSVALAVEELLGLVVPPRAVWLRMLLAEHTRIASHLGFLGWWTRRIPDGLLPSGASVTQAREALRKQLLSLTGNRVHPMITRIGGLAVDASPDWLAAELTAISPAVQLAQELLAAGPVAGTAAPVSAEVVAGYGLSGPVARAAGVARDVRVDTPYLDYETLFAQAARPEIPSVTNDASGRLALLAHEVIDSAALIAETVEHLAGLAGPIEVPLPKVIKVPEAETFVATEAPLGRAGCHLVSRGQPTPWRLRLRTPSSATVSALPAILPGCPVEQLEAVLASLGYVVGDVDK